MIVGEKRIWTCNSFEGVWPAGTAAVIVAESAEHAAALLTEQIRYIAKQVITADEVKEVDTSKSHAIVLSNGDY